MKASTKLRELMKKAPVLVAGSWDALSAKMVEKMGFDAAYMTGGGVSLSCIGKPDLAYVTQTEMLEVARRITSVIRIPLIADIDDGFGNPWNVQRTMQICQSIGVAAVQIEDMAPPKRCAAAGGGKLGPAEAMENKIKAALEVKEDPDFIIIARTDNYDGPDELIRRAKLYEEAGADVIYPVALTERKDYEQLSKAVSIPLMDTPAGDRPSPNFKFNEVQDLNIRLYSFTLEGFTQAYKTQHDFLKKLIELKNDNTKELPLLCPTMSLIHEFECICELENDEQIQKKYLPKS